MDIKQFKDLINAIGGAGDEVSEIADGIQYLVETGAEGYDVAKAKVIYAKLVETSVEVSSLRYARSAAMESFRDYLRYLRYCEASPTTTSELDRSWEMVTSEVVQLLAQVNYLLERIEDARGDFDQEPRYDQLHELVKKRQALAQSLVSSGRPRTPEEVELVHEAADRYDILIEQLGRARDEMNVYIRTFSE
ncbi:hypothetical protein [Paraburkholderia acidiphila]|uniref:Uncharacterized protein n=1 Tax=Paraburkholderia acidiphila TaxID=2571747 RepID=A0A7Z2G8B3_9BURK|nr:hypothetical protein [Paraburkholderia acidiphila]QGZ57072.1 hypothetical protein FAZ97_19230 [Paraburkholderia acidiphila]